TPAPQPVAPQPAKVEAAEPPPPKPQAVTEKPQAPVEKAAAPAPPAAKEAPSNRSQSQVLNALRSAVDENRLDVYLQPMVTLPQRKVRFYEAVTRRRDERDQVLPAEDFIGGVDAAGRSGRVDH